MATVSSPLTLADRARRLGVPLERIRGTPTPGTATEADRIAIDDAGRDPLCKLIDGVLVERPLGLTESFLQTHLSMLIVGFVQSGKLGLVCGSDRFYRTVPGHTRSSSLSVYLWGQFLGRRRPTADIGDGPPALAIEVLRPLNTVAEMRIRPGEHFATGTVLIWEVDPRQRTVAVYTEPGAATVLTGRRHARRR